MKKKLYLRIQALALVLLLILTGFVITPQQVQADTTSTGDEQSSQVAEGSSATEVVTDESVTTPESNQEHQNELDMADTEDKNPAESPAERSFEQIDETDPLSDVLSETEQTSSDVVTEQTEQEVAAEQTEQEIITDISDALDADDTETAAEDKNRTITYTPEEDFTFIPETGTIKSYKKDDPVVNIPPSINGVPVTRIGGGAFMWKMKTTSVTIPDSVTEIGKDAFYDSRLTYLKLGNNIKTIGDHAFYNNKLTSVKLPDTITSMGWCVFDDNELTSINIPSGLTKLEFGVFRNNKLTNIKIPDGVTSIDDSVFYGNKLESVTIPNNVTSIGDHAFAWNEIKNVTILNNVTDIGTGAFKRNQITNFKLPQNLKLISNELLAHNKLTSITIPNKVTRIGSNAFFNNQIIRVTIPNSVTEIGGGCFQQNPVITASVPDNIERLYIPQGAYYEEIHLFPDLPYIVKSCFDPGVALLSYVKAGSNIKSAPDGTVIETLKLPIYVKGTFEGEDLKFTYKGQTVYVHYSDLTNNSPPFTGYAKSTANVRNSPNGSVTGTILRGHKVSGTLAGNWVRFTYSGKTCYVYSSMLQADPIKVTRYIYANSIIRSAPNGSMITKLWRPLLINGTLEGAWTKFTYNGKTAYVASSLTTTNNPPITGYAKSAINVRNAPGGSVIGTIPIGRQVKGVLVGNMVRFTYNNRTGYVSASLLQATPVKVTRYIIANSIIRSAPNGSIIIRTWRPLLVSGTIEGAWLKFTYNSRTAYVAMSLTTTGNPAMTGYAKQKLYVRNTPNGSVVGTIPRGSKVSGVLVGNMVRFTYNGKTSYVYASLLQKDPVK